MKNNTLRASVPYAPGSIGAEAGDPMRLAAMAPRAIDQIGNSPAEEFERKADALEAEAKKIADKMRELAGVIRAHTEIANTRVAAFCALMTDVHGEVRGLEVKIGGQAQQQEQPADDGAPVPAFLGKGPRAGELPDVGALN